MNAVIDRHDDAEQSDDEPAFLASPRARTRRVVKDRIATVGIVGAFILVLVPLVAVIAYVIAKGAAAVNWQFLTTSPIQNRPDQPDTVTAFGEVLKFGMAPAIVGTLLTVGIATLISVPLGVMGGIYLNEYGSRSPLSRFLRLLTDCMTGVPSVVMGLFVFTFLVLRTETRNAFAGGLALAFLMLPVIIRATEEMLQLVPGDQREASQALGCRKAGTIVRVVLPSAAPGILSGILLAVARAAGETAPLLFVIGLTYTTNWKLLSGENTALSVQTYANAAQPFPPAVERAWGCALTLIVLAFVATIVARMIASRFSRHNAS
ncbi:MAG: phosphate ABC transporter permease PstA [Acidimicrobiia bacterium]